MKQEIKYVCLGVVKCDICNSYRLHETGFIYDKGKKTHKVKKCVRCDIDVVEEVKNG